MTIDQRASRTSDDLVEPLLQRLHGSVPVVRHFERTAGDETQGLLDDPSAVVQLALELAQTDHWSVGIGVGEVKMPLPASTRAAAGPALEYARTAVEDAKHAGGHICVRGEHPACGDVDAVLQLLGALSLKRSAAAVEAGSLLAGGATQQEIASRLGITQQAVSARLRAGLWQEDQRVRQLAVRRLEEAAE
ncbi:SatD family protein [Arthrobacter castelli]|uniref:SatD family protein n=1 Tax=Arthrobacter castelli TaxID=271431 RepID=UPI001FE212F0|nr:SatD family protein [Arthrobacter castelli]